MLAATLTVAQGRLLEDQVPAAITAVQFLGAAIGALPVALITEGLPHAPAAGGPGMLAVLAVLGLAAVGTLAPFTLFAYGQHKVSTEVAGAFLNLEPLVGALVGVLAFGDPAGPRLALGGVVILAGIVMSSLPALRAPPNTVPPNTVPRSPRPANATDGELAERSQGPGDGVSGVPGTPGSCRNGQNGAMEISDTLGFLLGTWEVSRSYTDRRSGTAPSFQGEAVLALDAGGLTLDAAGPDWARYEETGQLCLGAQRSPASRSLHYARRPGGTVMLYRPGRQPTSISISPAAPGMPSTRAAPTATRSPPSSGHPTSCRSTGGSRGQRRTTPPSPRCAACPARPPLQAEVREQVGDRVQDERDAGQPGRGRHGLQVVEGRSRRTARPTTSPAPARRPALDVGRRVADDGQGGRPSRRRRRSSAVSGMSGQGRPRPASAGDRNRSTSELPAERRRRSRRG